MTGTNDEEMGEARLFSESGRCPPTPDESSFLQRGRRDQGGGASKKKGVCEIFHSWLCRVAALLDFSKWFSVHPFKDTRPTMWVTLP